MFEVRGTRFHASSPTPSAPELHAPAHSLPFSRLQESPHTWRFLSAETRAPVDFSHAITMRASSCVSRDNNNIAVTVLAVLNGLPCQQADPPPPVDWDMCGRPVRSKKNFRVQRSAQSGADMCPATN